MDDFECFSFICCLFVNYGQLVLQVDGKNSIDVVVTETNAKVIDAIKSLFVSRFGFCMLRNHYIESVGTSIDGENTLILPLLGRRSGSLFLYSF